MTNLDTTGQVFDWRKGLSTKMLLEKKFGMSLDKFKQSGTKWDKFWMQLQTDFDPSFEGVTNQNQGCWNEHLA